jgi:hypothetical protein
VMPDGHLAANRGTSAEAELATSVKAIATNSLFMAVLLSNP